MKIRIKRGLDVPLSCRPEGEIHSLKAPAHLSLNLDPFENIRFKVHVKVGDQVNIGTPLAENKAIAGQMFVSPCGGVVAEVRRGIKRRLLDIVIKRDLQEKREEHGSLDPYHTPREKIVEHLLKGGIFSHIRARPFDLIADPKYIPRDIFVRAVESLPYLPSAEMQLKGHEKNFQIGLTTLSKLTSGHVHLVHQEGSTVEAFTKAEHVLHHSISGPHPMCTSSVHIHAIRPIEHVEDIVWTLSVTDVIAVGKMMTEGHYYTERVLSIAGNGVLDGKRGYFRGRMGFPIVELVDNCLKEGPNRIISGDPLTGQSKERDDFIGFTHTALSVIPENTSRELFHFLGLGAHKYSALPAYASGHISPPPQGYDFTTNQHGEERAFVDGSVYDRVMPMKIPTMLLIKALLAENYELAMSLGLLEVAPEDFALPSFICPSKIEMMEIVAQGLRKVAAEFRAQN